MKGGIVICQQIKKKTLFLYLYVSYYGIFYGTLNISIHLGGFNLNSIKTTFVAFPITLIIAYILETFVVGKINHILLEKFVKETDSKNSFILFNCFFIVTMMSLIMTIIGGLLGGDNLQTIFTEFLLGGHEISVLHFS